MKYKILILSSFAIVLGLTITGCKKKPCKVKHQTTHTFSMNDSIYIDTLGSWVPQSYTMDITTCKKDQYELVIYNLGNLGETVDATLGGTNVIINEQDVSGNIYSGNGLWLNDNLTINYEYISSAGDTLIGAGTE